MVGDKRQDFLTWTEKLPLWRRCGTTKFPRIPPGELVERGPLVALHQVKGHERFMPQGGFSKQIRA
jgi:hypothetical protein